VNLTVNKATPTITWATPAAITYGTALSATQLNATASVPGSFVYSPAAGTVPAVGSQTLSATFTPTDATDYTTATGTVNLTVNAAGNQPPTVSLTTPANGANYTAPGSVTLTATAADSDGTIAKVEFYQGATLLGTDTTSPYSYAWTNVTAGSYSLTAKAYDNSGAITTSTAVGITVNAPGNQPPTLSLTAPANGATYTAPASVTLTANAADSDGTITKVEFYQGTILLGTATTSPYRFTWTNVAAGSYSLTAKAYDNGGAITTSAAVGIAVNAVSAPPSGGTGLLGEYYDNMDFTDLKVTRTDATVNFNWGSGSPDPALGADTFSVRWTGQIQAQFSETYTFYTQSDDGVRLWVNGQQLIDNWTNHATVENSGTIALAAGQSYDLKLEYYQNTGGAVASLLWSSPSTPKAGIPQSQLFPAAPAPVTATTTPPASEGKKCGTGTGFAALLAFSFLVLGLRRNRD
jgi:predicted phage tail protein